MNKEVSNLEEVRQNIDRLDKQIVSLLGERYYYVTQAARFKTTTDDVKAPSRVEKVIAKVREQALQENIDLDIIENIYRAMINCFIHQELKVHRKS